MFLVCIGLEFINPCLLGQGYREDVTIKQYLRIPICLIQNI